MRAAVLFFALASAVASASDGLHVPAPFVVETIARINGARELAALPNGDLIVGTRGQDVYILPNAEGTAGTPQVFAHFDDTYASGVAFDASRNEIYVGTMHHVWVIAYHHGEQTAAYVKQIADVRAGSVAAGTDGDEHYTTSVAFSKGLIYVAAGSSCNATMAGGTKPCEESDPTRSAVSVIKPGQKTLTQRAHRIRNAIALAVNPDSGSVWVGDAGQDDLPFGHPYEFLDDLSVHPANADYGWPVCDENHHEYWPGYDCSKTVVPLVVLPAYSTLIGAAFYPLDQRGSFTFPAQYRGGLFVAAHGSWHRNRDGCAAAPARVVFVAMRGDRPAQPVNWQNPATQWRDFVTGFQSGCTDRIGRPTGLAVGPKGSLFIADDAAGLVYRVRPQRG
jgi:glucose/arabinose dehydrogenase